MQFYRRLTPIKAISFDLDDTLYNIPQRSCRRLKARWRTTLQKNLPLLPELLDDPQQVFNRRFWGPYRQQAIKAHQDISHDVVRLRYGQAIV